MALVGNYDASTFVDGNYATYPPLPAGATLYQPTMHWLVVGAGVVQGHAVGVGDSLFASAGHLYGDETYGDLVYGADTTGNWTIEEVRFLPWNPSLPGPTPLYPNAGCPFTRPDLLGGDWAPGWRIVIEAYYNDLRGSRIYGLGNYGDDVFGDTANVGEPAWVDMTQPSFTVTCGDGTRDGGQTVPVSEVVIDLVDQTGEWFEYADPWFWYQPTQGSPIRVGFIDPQWGYHAVVVGELERVEDVHDGEKPRTVTIRAFGRIMDLTVDVIGVQRPAEMASTRFMALASMAGFDWGAGGLVFPGDAPLHADKASHDIVVRTELDRTVQSCGWFLDQDRYGALRVRYWPHEGIGPTLHVVDCFDGGDDDTVRLSPSIVFVDDQSRLLNYTIVTNDDSPKLTEVRGEDPASIGRFGRRGRTLGYPKTGLAFADIAFTAGWVDRIVNRWGAITRHIEDVTADTAVDHGWLAVLADLDTGRPIDVERRGLHHRLFFDTPLEAT